MKKKYAAQDQWAKEHTQYVGLKLNCNTDADILQAINAAKSKQGFIKDAIRYYLKAATNSEE